MRDPGFHTIDSSSRLLAPEVTPPKQLPLENLPRLCVERGDYRDPSIEFVSTTLVSHDWSSWKHYILSKPRHVHRIWELNIEHALELSAHRSIYRANKALASACLRWISGVHTLGFAWGEGGCFPTLEDVVALTGLPIHSSHSFEEADPNGAMTSSDSEVYKVLSEVRKSIARKVSTDAAAGLVKEDKRASLSS